MKKLLLISVAFMLAGCVAYPVYDEGYYYPDYGPYPYGYVRPDVNVFVSGFHGGHGFHGGAMVFIVVVGLPVVVGFHGGGHGFVVVAKVSIVAVNGEGSVVSMPTSAPEIKLLKSR
jgi:hypothetical protein